MKYIITILILLGSYSTARAAGTGNELIVECKVAAKMVDDSGANFSTSEQAKAAHCLGVVEGVRDTLGIWKSINEEKKLPITSCACVPADVTNIQTVRIVLKFLDTHPEMLNVENTALVAIALFDTYPCKA